MTNIYKIKNLTNDLVYIGQTKLPIELRLKEHIKTAKRFPWRPLYHDFLYYGIEKFSIELIEQVEDQYANEKEKYWVKQYNSFYHGYNSTFGGDGRRIVDLNEKEIVQSFKEGCSIKNIAINKKHSEEIISGILKKHGIDPIQFERNKKIKELGHKVVVIDITTKKEIQKFNSIGEAARWILQTKNKPIDNKKIENIRANIGRCCNQKRKTAYGFA